MQEQIMSKKAIIGVLIALAIILGLAFLASHASADVLQSDDTTTRNTTGTSYQGFGQINLQDSFVTPTSTQLSGLSGTLTGYGVKADNEGSKNMHFRKIYPTGDSTCTVWNGAYIDSTYVDSNDGLSYNATFGGYYVTGKSVTLNPNCIYAIVLSSDLNIHGSTEADTYMGGYFSESGLNGSAYLKNAAFILEGVDSSWGETGGEGAPVIAFNSISQTADNSFIAAVDFTAGESGNYFVRAKLVTATTGLDFCSGADCSLNWHLEGQTSDFFQESGATSTQFVYLENLPAGRSFDALKMDLYKQNFSGAYVFWATATSSISESTGSGAVYSPPVQSGEWDVDVISAATSSKGIAAVIDYEFVDDTWELITEVRTATTTSIFREIADSGNSTAGARRWSHEYVLANGTYKVWATLRHYTGLTYETITSQSDWVTVSISNNTATNPPEQDDSDIEDSNLLGDSVKNLLDRFNPFSKFPFSWVSKLVTDVKEARATYASSSKEFEDISWTFKVGSMATTSITLLTATSTSGWFRSGTWNLVYGFMQSVLWLGLAWYLFRRVSRVLNEGFKDPDSV